MRAILLLPLTWTVWCFGAEGAWRRIGPDAEPGRSIPYLVRCADDRLWCATRPGGVWFSADRGATWTSAHGPPTDGEGATGANHGLLPPGQGRDGAVVGYENTGIWVQTGDGWQQRNQGLPKGRARNAVALAADPATPGRWLLGTDGGLFQTTDHGGRWKRITGGLPDGKARAGDGDCHLTITRIIHLDERGREVILGIYATGEGQPAGVWRSLDAGSTWTCRSMQIGREPPAGDPHRRQGDMIFGLDVDPFDPQTWCAVAWGGVYLTHDRGETWNRVRAGCEDTTVWFDRSRPGRLWVAGGLDRLQVSSDRGATWQDDLAGLPTGPRPGARPVVVPLTGADGTTAPLTTWSILDTRQGRDFAQRGATLYIAWSDGIYARELR